MSFQATTSTWERDSPSPAASFFCNPVVAVAVGIILPSICVVFDPIVFRTSVGDPILGSYRIVGYGFITLSMLALGVWLLFRRFPSLFCGFLAAGCLFALVLGIVLLPISVIGLFAIIGILGFSPFLTAATFWYCAKHARQLAGSRFNPALAILAFALLIALPLTTQAGVSRIVNQSLTLLVEDPDASTDQAVRRLQMLGPLLDPDILVWRYEETRSEAARERIARAYHQLTGGDIKVRLRRLLD